MRGNRCRLTRRNLPAIWVAISVVMKVMRVMRVKIEGGAVVVVVVGVVVVVVAV